MIKDEVGVTTILIKKIGDINREVGGDGKLMSFIIGIYLKKITRFEIRRLEIPKANKNDGTDGNDGIAFCPTLELTSDMTFQRNPRIGSNLTHRTIDLGNNSKDLQVIVR
jgi:hypothetical protein